MKKLTIVTITYNAFSVLENTIKSVLLQKENLFDYIIIDGGSNDGTIEIIEKYQNKLKFWQSKKDNGIYDAMNISLQYVTTEWICFMNAGDIFFSNNVIYDIFNNDKLEKYDILYGNHAFYKEQNLIVKKPLLLQNIWKRMPMCHQSIFVKSKIIKNKPFNLEYTFASDYDFILNHYSNFPDSFKYINLPISIISLNGFSESNSINTYKEYMKISGMYYKGLFYNTYFKIKISQRKIISILKQLINKYN
jgi:glycosyltransferase involved in cell wall biosynthesis